MLYQHTGLNVIWFCGYFCGCRWQKLELQDCLYLYNFVYW